MVAHGENHDKKKKRKKESGLLEWQDGEEGGLEVGRVKRQ